MLVRAAGNNANLLLNIGPMPNGEIQPEFVERLHAVGEWVSRYGEVFTGSARRPILRETGELRRKKKDKNLCPRSSLERRVAGSSGNPGKVRAAHSH